MTEIAVGKEVLSQCSKCKHALAHIIVTMKNEKTIGKVQCKTCEHTHVYKDPSKVKLKKAKAKSKTGRRKSSENSISDIWMEAINKSSSKSQAYSIKNNFIIGDIIDHTKFGPGVVEKLMDQDKIEVIFRHDIKILMHNKN